MSFSPDPTLPANSENIGGGLGASRIRNVTTWVLAFFGLPASATTINTAPFTTDVNANVSANGTLTVPTPTAAGHAATKAYVDAAIAIAFSGTTSGTDTYTVTLTPTPASQAALLDRALLVNFPNSNTGPATLNANSFGAQAIQKNGNALAGGDIPANSWIILTWDGTNYQITSAIQPSGAYSCRNLQGNVHSGNTSQFDVTADVVTFWNPTSGGISQVKSFSATVDISTSGPALNGRDQAGAFGATDTIHLYAITGTGQTAGLIASKTAPPTGPTLPSGYSQYAYLASFILISTAFGNQLLRGDSVFTNGKGDSILSAQTASGFTTATNEANTGLVPAIAQQVRYYCSMDCVTGTSGNHSFGTLTVYPQSAVNAAGRALNSGGSGNTSGETAGNSMEITFPNTGNITVITSNLSQGGGASANISVFVVSYTVPNNG